MAERTQYSVVRHRPEGPSPARWPGETGSPSSARCSKLNSASADADTVCRICAHTLLEVAYIWTPASWSRTPCAPQAVCARSPVSDWGLIDDGYSTLPWTSPEPSQVHRQNESKSSSRLCRCACILVLAMPIGGASVRTRIGIRCAQHSSFLVSRTPRKAKNAASPVQRCGVCGFCQALGGPGSIPSSTALCAMWVQPDMFCGTCSAAADSDMLGHLLSTEY
ncbi:hypothetical protein OH76DRAFT_366876 [Lentinus brumalis]|uniref:Uncharacterized protein n=1 Tax=Lentinus brumalis TaxID=2498619 RepID=A0A371DE49_9APHY|nr:hypothetical protein OH76DRAFT_366876 [Polyporus brumalis]